MCIPTYTSPYPDVKEYSNFAKSFRRPDWTPWQSGFGPQALCLTTLVKPISKHCSVSVTLLFGSCSCNCMVFVSYFIFNCLHLSMILCFPLGCVWWCNNYRNVYVNAREHTLAHAMECGLLLIYSEDSQHQSPVVNEHGHRRCVVSQHNVFIVNANISQFSSSWAQCWSSTQSADVTAVNVHKAWLWKCEPVVSTRFHQ